MYIWGRPISLTQKCCVGLAIEQWSNIWKSYSFWVMQIMCFFFFFNFELWASLRYSRDMIENNWGENKSGEICVMVV